MKRLLLIALLLLALNAGEVGAQTIHLQATPHVQRWESKHKLPEGRTFSFRILVQGHDISGRGLSLTSCRYTLFVKRLALELAVCGPRAVIKYAGRGRFTFVYSYH